MAVTTTKHIQIRLEGKGIHDVEVYPDDTLSRVVTRAGLASSKLEVWSPTAPGRLMAPTDPVHNMVHEGTILSAAPASVVG